MVLGLGGVELFSLAPRRNHAAEKSIIDKCFPTREELQSVDVATQSFDQSLNVQQKGGACPRQEPGLGAEPRRPNGVDDGNRDPQTTSSRRCYDGAVALPGRFVDLALPGLNTSPLDRQHNAVES